MKKIKLSFLCSILFSSAFAQNNIGINNSNPVPSAALMVDTASTGPQGMLVPRMTQARRNAISSPATGLMIFQTDITPGFFYYTGTSWTSVGAGAGPVTVLAVSKNASQTTSVGSSITDPDVISFQNITTSVSSTIASWNSSTNTFTVGASGAGWYLIDIQLTSQTTYAIPMIELNGGGATNANNLYGTGMSNTNTLQGNYKNRGTLQRVVYLNANEYFQVRAASGSTATGAPINGDAGSYLKVVKLN